MDVHIAIAFEREYHIIRVCVQTNVTLRTSVMQRNVDESVLDVVFARLEIDARLTARAHSLHLGQSQLCTQKRTCDAIIKTFTYLYI